ncbi:hypothetical protein ACQPX6_17565 [Actinomycetospora sp. CA-101289]|uniref:hypothetical protein n=1 Tax=Actinomycetospora sp. CA-101289 TaxID=3239893 RepID=UPI003D96FAE8
MTDKEGQSLRDRLAAALVAGEWLDLLPDQAGGARLDEAVMSAWGEAHDLAAEDLRSLLLGRGLPAQEAADPRGVRLRGVRIVGRLDLDHVTATVPLTLADCRLDQGVSAYSAHLPYMALERCHVTSEHDPALNALSICLDDDLRLNGSLLTTTAANSPTVALFGARIIGGVFCNGAWLVNDSAPALAAEGVRAGTGLFLVDGFRARGAGGEGAVGLIGAHITGQLNCRGAELVNESGPALVADMVEVIGAVALDDGFRARGAGEEGAVRLTGAHITSQLSCRGAELVNESGPALDADQAVVGGGVVLDGVRARGAGEYSAVRLLDAHISVRLNSRGAELVNESGPALVADRAEVGGGVVLDGVRARGAGEYGAVRLAEAHITGQLNCRGAWLVNESGPALVADGVEVSGAVLLDGGFRTAGGRGALISLSSGKLGTLNLTEPTETSGNWDLDGVTYAGIKPEDVLWWLALLRWKTPLYAAQPYQQLAHVYRAAGHEHEVRKILIAQREDQIARGGLSWHEKAWAKFTGVVLGYGWKPWRSLYGLAGVFIVSAVLAVVLGFHGALTHPPRPGAPLERCTVVEQVGAGFDLGTPLLGSATKVRDRCGISPDSTSATATALLISTWVLQLAAWAFAALFIAGFTGAVRKM